MVIRENMVWPPQNLSIAKMKEHACWYSGDTNLLTDFYHSYETKSFLNLSMKTSNRNTFWGRQARNDTDFCIHVPIASDIAETSAAFLFGESPIIKVNNAMKDVNDVESDNENLNNSQSVLDAMLLETGFFQKLLEGAETCSAIGGCYLKIAWNSDVCEYPIPLVVQSDCAIPEFKYGFLTKVIFPYEYKDNDDSSKVYRLLETYEKGQITNELYFGSKESLGLRVELSDLEQTKDLEDVVDTNDLMLAEYIPNILPNRLERNSRAGRSDYQGIETLMDSLDEVFSAWMIDVQIARGKILIPESYLDTTDDGSVRFNLDKSMYVKLDVDPTNTSENITVTQFAIRSADFEKTALNLLDRIITSAGYSPQSFGLNIEGRAESGTALNVRERKSFATTNKKETYWEKPIKNTIKNMCALYVSELGGEMEAEVDINVSFADGITNNMDSLASSVKMLSDAKAISTDTKIRMIHPEWSEDQITKEIKLIEEEGKTDMMPPDGMDNLDIEQTKLEASKDLGEDKE